MEKEEFIVELDNSGRVYVNNGMSIIATFDLKKSLFGKVRLKLVKLSRLDKLDAVMAAIKEAEKALGKINKYL